MKKTKELTKDAIFCAIVCTLIFLFNFITAVDYMYISMIITIFLGCYFQNKSLTRKIASAAVILGITLLIIDPFHAIIIILPSLIMGVLVSIFLKLNLKFSIFFLIITSICFILNVIMELAFVKYIIQMDLIEYIAVDEMFGTTDYMLSLGDILVWIYMFVILLISCLQALLTFNVNKLYKKRIMPLIGEKINESERV